MTEEEKREYFRAHPEKCPFCSKMIVAVKFGEYGWLYICEECEINWRS